MIIRFRFLTKKSARQFWNRKPVSKLNVILVDRTQTTKLIVIMIAVSSSSLRTLSNMSITVRFPVRTFSSMQQRPLCNKHFSTVQLSTRTLCTLQQKVPFLKMFLIKIPIKNKVPLCSTKNQFMRSLSSGRPMWNMDKIRNIGIKNWRKKRKKLFN